MVKSLLASALFIAATVPALSQGTYPPTVEAFLKDNRAMCDKFTAKKGFARNDVDLNGDGLKDWIFDYGHVDCDGAASFFCGSAGCTMQIVVSDGSGRWVEKFNGNAQGYKITARKGRTVVKLGLHGSACGKIGAAPCSTELVFTAKQ